MEAKKRKIIIEREVEEDSSIHDGQEFEAIGSIDLLNTISISNLNSFIRVIADDKNIPYCFSLQQNPVKYVRHEFSIDNVTKQLDIIKEGEIIESINYESDDEYCRTIIECQAKIYNFEYNYKLKSTSFAEYLKKPEGLNDYDSHHKIFFTEQIGLKFQKFINTTNTIQDKFKVKLFFLELYLASARAEKLNPKSIPSHETVDFYNKSQHYSVIYLPSDLQSNTRGNNFIEIFYNQPPSYERTTYVKRDSEGPIPNNDWMEGDESNYWNID